MKLLAQPPALHPRPVDDAGDVDWAERTRGMLTRDLLVRARHARPEEARCLEFRALHLNLPVIAEVAERLGLSQADRAAVEHDALGGLLEALHLFDPYGEQDFAWFAAARVEQQMHAALTRRRSALQVAGPHT